MFFQELCRVRLLVVLLFVFVFFVPLFHPIHAFYVEDEGHLGSEMRFAGGIVLSHAVTLMLNLFTLHAGAPYAHLTWWGIIVPAVLYLALVFFAAVLSFMFPLFSVHWLLRPLFVIPPFRYSPFLKNAGVFVASLIIVLLLAEGFLAFAAPQKITILTLPEAVEAQNVCVADFSHGGGGIASLQLKNWVITNPFKVWSNGTEHSFTLNSSAGIYNMPDCVMTHPSEDGSRFIAIQTNNHGMRMDYNITQEKKLGKKRILILGDSFAFGVGLDQNETITAFLQQLVGNETEVLNGAIQGLSSLQSYLLYKHEYQSFDPDIVIFLHYMNDVRGNLQLRSDYLRPVYSSDLGGVTNTRRIPIQNQTLFSSIVSPLADNLHIIALIDKNRDVFLNRRRVMSAEPTDLDIFYTYQKNPLDVMNRALNFNCFVLQLLQKTATERNDAFLVVYIPAHLDIDEPYFQRSIQSFVNVSPEEFDYRLARERTALCAEQSGLPFLDLTPHFLNAIEKKPLELYSSPGGHWSPKATNLTAHILYNLMKENKLDYSE